jgi:succinoglycan biosynthesis transport protein ExoP
MRPFVHRLEREFEQSAAVQPVGGSELLIDFEAFLRAIRRQRLVFAYAVLASLLAGILWLLVATPLYTADTLVLIDNRRIHAVEESYDAQSPVPELAASLIDSQVEIVKSEKLAQVVIRRLNLTDDPRFNIPAPSLGAFLRFRRALIGIFPSGASKTLSSPQASSEDEMTQRRMVDLVRGGVDVRRVGRTMILQLLYTSSDPAEAARLASGYAEAYLSDQLDTKYEATKRASQWLEERMEELKQKALESDLAIQKFKKDHHLISSGGKLVNEQQLTEVNSQLVLARAETSKAQARYARISSIIEGHQTDAIVAEAIGSQIIGQLRAKYLELSKRQADISDFVGKDHLQAVSLRKEMAEYERLMFEELGRLAEGARSDLDIATTREQSLLSSLEKLVVLNAGENTTLVKLHEMEREGEAYQKLHQTFLQRYQEALQQQSFPIIEARVITKAVTPQMPSSPKKALTLVMFGFLGASVGCALGFILEFRERGLRGEHEVKDELGLECLGILPLIAKPAGSNGKINEDYLAKKRDRASVRPPGSDRRWLPSDSSLTSYVLNNPRSEFAETLLAAKLSADLALSDEATKVIGVVSVLPNEGKSIVSKNLASLVATLGFSTLLVDADLRRREITRGLIPGPADGLVEAILRKQSLEEFLWWEKLSNLAILPSTSQSRISHSSEVLSSNGMSKLLDEAKERFKYVVLDLPPLGPIIDVRAMAEKIDAFVFVVEWRTTPRKLVQSILRTERTVAQRCLGVILNKVKIADIRLFEDRGSRHYYREKYGKYYGS